jgi:hypothetical protein
MRQCTIRERLRLTYIDFISCSESVLIYFLALTVEQVNWQRYGTKRETNIFLYEIGRDPEELCLGNLILKDYANPTTSQRYTHPRLK